MVTATFTHDPGAPCTGLTTLVRMLLIDSLALLDLRQVGMAGSHSAALGWLAGSSERVVGGTCDPRVL